jgi:hypothetical protein
MDVPAAGTSALAAPSAEPPPLGDRSDTLSDVLEVVRLTGALFFLVDARTPWVAEAPASPDLGPVILPKAQHVVSYHVVCQGDCWSSRRGTPRYGSRPGMCWSCLMAIRISWRARAA